MWNPYELVWNVGEPEPLCGTFVELGTFMWNLAEPGARFRAAAPHPEVFLEEPEAFQVVGKKMCFIYFF